ncbi:AAA family ATPase [Brevibacillus migulae]|uniref:AAA family ATPase n=1 Tax=Brevibacillus migulae TaxID=1644114 RepID=UPI00106E1367|nr:response regulator [Brevibacillus migulae]
MPAIRVLIVDDSLETRTNMIKLLSFEEEMEVVGEAENGADALEKVLKLYPDVVLMDVNMPVMDGLKATEKISLISPKTAVIIISVQEDPDYLRKAMMAGAKDYLVKPVSTEQLVATIQDVYQLEAKRRSRMETSYLEDHFVNRPRALCLISAKGGIGKTTLAVNIATALALQGRKTVLLDFDLQYGDTALLLSAKASGKNLHDLVKDASEIDSDVLMNYLEKMESGLFLLRAPLKPEHGEAVATKHIHQILTICKEMFEWIIVDTAPQLNDTFFAIIDQCDEHMMVSTPNLAVAKNNKHLLDLMQSLSYPLQDWSFMLNRAHARTGLRMKDVEDILGRKMDFEVGNDFAFVDRASNEGIPFVVKNPKHRLSKQISHVISKWMEEDSRRQIKGRKRFFPFLKMLGFSK